MRLARRRQKVPMPMRYWPSRRACWASISNAAVCAYADMDADQDGFTIRGNWSAPGSASIVGHYSLAAFGNLAVRNLRAGLPLVLNDNRGQLPPEEAATFLSIGLAATICMPLVKEGRLTALMAIHDRVPRVWTADELATLTRGDRAVLGPYRAGAQSRGSARKRDALPGSRYHRPDRGLGNRHGYANPDMDQGRNGVVRPRSSARSWPGWRRSGRILAIAAS